MEEVTAYFDLCIPEKCVGDNFNKTAKLLVELGYRTIAINQVLEETNLESKKKKKKGEPRDVADVVPAPLDIKCDKGCEELKILNRLTIVFSNQEVLHKIVKSQNYKKYHIVAVLPLTQAAFQFTCSSVDADILTFDPEGKPPYRINRKLYNHLIERRFYFEILYGPAIQDSSQRKNIINLAHIYHALGKSKNIIISSGATNRMLIRSPYDVINLAFIFGLSEEQAKGAISHCARQVYINSVGRRHGKAVMFIENIRETETKEEQDTDDEMEVDQPAQKKTKQ